MYMPKQQVVSEAAFKEILQSVHKLGAEVVEPYAEEVDRDARFPTEAMNALKEAKLLSCYVPQELGGMGLDIIQTAAICEVLGLYCATSAMIFAMHQIQVACVVHHAQDSEFFRNYQKTLVAEQRLMASATTELGVGGDLRSSICAVKVAGDDFELTKQAPVISYGEAADDILVTCRRTEDSPASDQVHVMVCKDHYNLEALSGWDTLGFRGTCSAGFTLSSKGKTEQILPTPFDKILSQTMHPVSHIVWGSLWAGLAGSAVNKARAFVRKEARKTPGTPPPSALRLAELDTVMQTMRNNIIACRDDYSRLLSAGDEEVFVSPGFIIKTNNLKLSSSQLVVDIVGKSVLIIGISSYRNDSEFSLCRHLRDAYGAALMVNNERILGHNTTLQLVHR